VAALVGVVVVVLLLVVVVVVAVAAAAAAAVGVGVGIGVVVDVDVVVVWSWPTVHVWWLSIQNMALHLRHPQKKHWMDVWWTICPCDSNIWEYFTIYLFNRF